MLDFLNQQFQHKNKYLTHAKQVQHSLNFPFGLSELEDGVLSATGEYLPLEDLLRAASLALDFETHNWQTIRVQEELGHLPEEELRRRFLDLAKAYEVKVKDHLLSLMERRDFLRGMEGILNDNRDERITVASVMDLENDNCYLIPTLPDDDELIAIDDPTGSREVAVGVGRVKDQYEVIERLNQLFQDLQLLGVFGHNQMKFDYGKAQELTKRFFPGVGGRKPIVMGHAARGYIVQRIIPGRLDLDPSGYSQHYCYSHNHKLDTVLRHVLGIDSPKTMTHEELAAKTKRAEEGNREDAREILYYAGQDAMKSFLLGRYLLEEHYLLGRVFCSLPARVDTTSKGTLSEEYHAYRHFERRHFFPEEFSQLHLSHVGSYEKFDPVDWIWKKVKIKTQKALTEGELVAIFPYARAFQPLFLEDPNIKAVYEEIERTSDQKRKYRLLRAMETLAAYPLFKSLDDELTEEEFTEQVCFCQPGRVLERLRERCNKIEEGLGEVVSEAINCNGNLVVIPVQDDNSDTYQRLVQANIIVPLGRGRFLSGTKGRFAGYVDGEFLMRGIADFASNKGERCPFEKTFYREFLRKVVVEGDLEGALLFLQRQCQYLAEEKVGQEEITYQREAKRDFTDYSIRASFGYIERMIEQRSREGDLVRYEYDLDQMREKFFGLKEETSKDLISTTAIVHEGKGTISEIVEWACPVSKGSAGRQALDRIYLGRSSDEDVKVLMEMK